jgi:hypothetical protein
MAGLECQERVYVTSLLHIERKMLQDSVDATNCKEAADLRTMLLSFHHMKEDLAREILLDAVRSRQGILIAELSERSFYTYFLFFLAFHFVAAIFCGIALVSTSKDAKECLKRSIWFIPAVVCMWFDGLVSIMRTYEDFEIKEIIQSIPEQEKFIWNFGSYRAHLLPIRYLLAFPRP